MLPTSKFFHPNPSLFDPSYHDTPIDTVDCNDLILLRCVENELVGDMTKIGIAMQDVNQERAAVAEKKASEMLEEARRHIRELKAVSVAGCSSDELYQHTIQLNHIADAISKSSKIRHQYEGAGTLRYRLRKIDKQLETTKKAISAALNKWEKQESKLPKRSCTHSQHHAEPLLSTSPSDVQYFLSFCEAELRGSSHSPMVPVPLQSTTHEC